MDGLSAAASVVAVVDMSAKVASLLVQYAKEVKSARDDVARVQRQVDGLKHASEGVQRLLDGSKGTKLEASHELLDALRESTSQLNGLEQRLRPHKTRKTMSSLGIRALKWPFDSKEIEKIIQGLETHSQAISLCLQVDQMSVAFLFRQGRLIPLD